MWHPGKVLIRITSRFKSSEPRSLEANSLDANIPSESNLELDKNKRYFLVTSHGQTASMWLAAILNKLPNVYCTHGYTYPPTPAKLHEISSDDISHRDASAKRFETLALNDYFKELDLASEASVVGNVLSFYLGRLLARSSGGQLKHENLRVVNIIRHPITRLNSTLKTWDPSGIGETPIFVPIDFNNNCSHIIKFIKGNFTVDLTTSKAMSFIVALLAMEHIARDVNLAKANGIINVKYEDMTTDINVFLSLISYLTGRESPEDRRLFQEIFTIERINAHNRTSKVKPIDQYLEWETWQQAAYNFVARRCDLNGVYSDYSYADLIPEFARAMS